MGKSASKKITRLLELTYTEERMDRLSKKFMLEVAIEQRSSEAHHEAKKKNETILRKMSDQATMREARTKTKIAYH